MQMHLRSQPRAVGARHGRPCCSRLMVSQPRASPVTSNTATAYVTADVLVDEVLDLIKDSDSGIGLPEATQARVDELIEQLEVVGRTQQPRPNACPLLWGNYNVAYTSIRKANQRGQPAGGRFRGPIGRALFKTEGLFQSCLAPDVCVNKVAFRLLGVISGAVGLRGRIIPITDVGDTDTVRVRFEPTTLSFGGLHLRLGSPSEVQLTTTYLDERVRLGKGSRGSMFVFTRGGAADTAGMEHVGLQGTSRATLALFMAGYMAVMLGSLAAFLAVPHPLVRAASSCVMALGGLMALVMRNGGVVRDTQLPPLPSDQPSQQQQQQQAVPGSA